MVERVDCIALCERGAQLREARSKIAGQPESLQRRAVNALARISERLLDLPDSDSIPTVTGGRLSGGEIALAWMSLRDTLRSWNRSELESLIERESVRAPLNGPGLTLHIIATNTPLLAWTSIARALLVESASLVRIPSEAPLAQAWSEYFVSELQSVDEELARLVKLVAWPSNELDSTRCAAEIADTVVVYGSDDTISKVSTITPNNRRFLGFGSRISFGVVLPESDFDSAARGSALDIAILDQQGCLSPQFIFLLGTWNETIRYSDLLAAELGRLQAMMTRRDARAGSKIREAVALARLSGNVHVRQDETLGWSVVAVSDPTQLSLSVPGLVTVVPVPGMARIVALLHEHGLLAKLQGVSVAAPDRSALLGVGDNLRELGVSYICEPGRLQRPPFDWREDGRDVLRSFI